MGYKVILSCTGYKVSILQVTVIPGITVACNPWDNSSLLFQGLQAMGYMGLLMTDYSSQGLQVRHYMVY